MMSADIIPAVRTIGERVRYALQVRGIGVNQLDRMLEKSDGYASRLTRSDRQPRADVVAKLIEHLNVRAEWLLKGEGPMDAPKALEMPGRAEAAATAKEYGVPPDIIQREIDTHPNRSDDRVWWLHRFLGAWADRQREVERSKVAKKEFRERQAAQKTATPAKEAAETTDEGSDDGNTPTPPKIESDRPHAAAGGRRPRRR